MLRSSAVASALALVALGLVSREPGGGCDGDGDGDGRVNAPCTRDRDCRHALTCDQGVCREPDAGAGTPASVSIDASVPADASVEAGP